MPVITHPDADVLEFVSPGQATAGTDTTWTLGRVKRTGTITKVTYTPNADITGVATNNRNMKLLNKKQDGNSVVVAAGLVFANGVNASDFDEKDIPLVTPIIADMQEVAVTEGDILAWFSDAQGTGMVDPGGLVTVTITPKNTGHSAAGLVRGFPAL